MVDKVESLFSAEGREDLLQEIRAIREAVQSADRINASLIDHYLQEYGTSVEELKDYAAELFDADEEGHST
jgi:undecaprenyl pyrophosphate synthase